MISGLRREVDENCALLGHYAASSTDVSGLHTGSIFKVQWTDSFSNRDPIPSSSKKSPKRPDRLWDPPSLIELVLVALSIGLNWPGQGVDHEPSYSVAS